MTNQDEDEGMDRLETPNIDYRKISDIGLSLGIQEPELDICASKENRKCYYYITKEQDCLKTEFLINGRIPETIWCNAPHTQYSKILPRVFEQYEKLDFNAIIFIPSNNERTNYWNRLVEPNRIEVNPKGFVFYFPYTKRVIFEMDGIQLVDKEGRPAHAQNGYKILLLVKKSSKQQFKSNLHKLST